MLPKHGKEKYFVQNIISTIDKRRIKYNLYQI